MHSTSTNPIPKKLREKNPFIRYKESLTTVTSSKRRNRKNKSLHKVLTMLLTMYFECFVCGWATCTKVQNLEKQKQNKNSYFSALIIEASSKSLNCVTYMLWWEAWSENAGVVLCGMSKHRKVIFKLWYDNKLILPFTYQCPWWKKDPQLLDLKSPLKSLHPIWRKKLKRCDAKGVKN